MKQSAVFVSFFLDASRPNADGKCLVKLNIYQKPHKKRYATALHLSKEDWTKLNSAKLRDQDLKEVKRKLSALKSQAEKAIEKIQPFSFVAFEEAFISDSAKSTASNKSRMVTDWFTNTVTKLRGNDQVSTAGSYQTTINSMNLYKKNLQIRDVTPAFLHAYEKHLIKEGKSLSTVGIYMRNLRAILNEAIRENVISLDSYPFYRL